jgi:hypothetical protein
MRQWEVAGGGANVGLVCGGGTSVDRSKVERERQGRACGIFLVIVRCPCVATDAKNHSTIVN